MELSFIKPEDLQPFFVSPYEEDLILANEILEQKKLETYKLDILVEDLNLIYREWHFFIENCCVKRVKAHRQE